MPQVPLEISQPHPEPHNPSAPTTSSQHGLHQHDPSGLYRVRSQDSSASPRSIPDLGPSSLEGVNADQLDEKLRGLNLGKFANEHPHVAGQRVSEYENALTPPTPRQAMGFKVIKRPDSASTGIQLTEFPNGQYRSPCARDLERG